MRALVQGRVGGSIYKLLRWLSDHRIPLFIALSLLCAAFILFGQTIKQLFFIGLFLFLGSISLIYNRWIRTSIGIEFITMGTVLCARVYGPWVGAGVGLIGLTAAEIIGTGFNPKTAISLIAVVILAFITPLFNGLPILTAGIILALIYDALIIPLYLMAGSSPARSAFFVITHLIWNAWIFYYVAPILEKLMIG